MSGRVAACGLCGSNDLTLILDLGDQPLAERHDSARVYPLALLECAGCTLVQLSYMVDQRELFPPDHPYTSGTSPALVEHFAALAARLSAALFPGDVVIDIAANDGSLLSQFPAGMRRVAVEPTRQARKCEVFTTDVWLQFFTANLAGRMAAGYKPAKVITACNVLAHVPDPHDFCEGVALLLADDGVFVVETGDVGIITDGGQFDVCYHEHARYFSIATLSRLLAAHGLHVCQTERIPTHGGSIRAWARKRSGGLQERAEAAAYGLHQLLHELDRQGHDIAGIGATTRASAIIHFAGIERFLGYVAEVPGSEKIGSLMPAITIPVVDEIRLIEDQPDFAVLFSWHIKDVIMPALRARGYKGKFIVPLPEACVVDD